MQQNLGCESVVKSGKKMKVMQVGKQVESVPVKVGQEPIEEVMSLIFLGNIVTSNGNAEAGISLQNQ